MALPISRGLQFKNYNYISSELIYYTPSFRKENDGISQNITCPEGGCQFIFMVLM